MDILENPRQKVLSEIKRLKFEEKYSYQQIADKLFVSVSYAYYLVKSKRGKKLDLMAITNLWTFLGKPVNDLFSDCDPLLQRLAMIEDGKVQQISIELVDELEKHPADHREGIITIIQNTLQSIRSIRATYPPEKPE